jgi:hypothetical protein
MDIPNDDKSKPKHVHEGIENRVYKWIQGKHGMIGFILLDKKSTREDWKALHDTIAEIAVRNARNKARKEASEKQDGRDNDE